MSVCYICGGSLISIGSIPFGRNIGTLPCTDETPVEYHRCTECSFICSLDMLQWDTKQLSERVYNHEYVLLDPGYNGERAKNVYGSLSTIFNKTRNRPIHLDYGSGQGFLSDLLRADKWKSVNYDPYTTPEKPSGKYKLVTAIEVVEHSSNIYETMEDMLSFLDRGGVILITTKLCDKDTPVDWWYICARSGHIGIQSKESMITVAKKCGLFFDSINDDYHYFQRTRNDFKELTGGIISGRFQR